MILGVGTDIEDVDRFRKLTYRKRKDFYDKIFTKREIKYCLQYNDPYPHFAVRFSAKEAIIKALGVQIGFRDIEVLHDKGGAPKIFIKGYKKSKLEYLVSLSHTRKMALSIVIAVSL